MNKSISMIIVGFMCAAFIAGACTGYMVKKRDVRIQYSEEILATINEKSNNPFSILYDGKYRYRAVVYFYVEGEEYSNHLFFYSHNDYDIGTHIPITFFEN